MVRFQEGSVNHRQNCEVWETSSQLIFYDPELSDFQSRWLSGFGLLRSIS